MANKNSKDLEKKTKKKTNENPISLNPLTFKEALADLLKVKPKKEETEKETKKADSE